MCCPHRQHESREGACVRATSGQSFASKCHACGRHPLLGQSFAIIVSPSSRNDDCCRTPPAGTTIVDAPGIHPHSSQRGDFGPLRRPREERTQGAAGFTGVKISMELLADRDLRDARHPLAPSWVVWLKTWRPKRPCPACVLRLLPYCPGSMHACKPPFGAPSLQILSMACATPGRPRNRPRPTQVM
jgi:hypothetical protein